MKTLVLTIMTLLVLTTSAAAWNELGHMIVVASAYDQLTPEVHYRVESQLIWSAKWLTLKKGRSLALS